MTNNNKKIPTKEKLIFLYEIKKMSTIEIAKFLQNENLELYGKTNKIKVINWLKFYKIPRRNNVEAMKRYYRSKTPTDLPKIY